MLISFPSPSDGGLSTPHAGSVGSSPSSGDAGGSRGTGTNRMSESGLGLLCVFIYPSCFQSTGSGECKIYPNHSVSQPVRKSSNIM